MSANITEGTLAPEAGRNRLQLNVFIQFIYKVFSPLKVLPSPGIVVNIGVSFDYLRFKFFYTICHSTRSDLC